VRCVDTIVRTLLALVALSPGVARSQQAIRVNRPQTGSGADAKGAASGVPAPGQPWVSTAPTPGGFYDDHTGKPGFYEPLTGEAFVPPSPPGQLPFSAHLGLSADVRKIAYVVEGSKEFEGEFYTEFALHWASEVIGGYLGVIPDSGDAITFGVEFGPYYGAELGAPAPGVKIAFLGPGLVIGGIKFDRESAPFAARMAIPGFGLGVTSSGDSGPPLYFLVRAGSPAIQLNGDVVILEVGYLTLESGIAFF
jgi:hypothetical protein